MADKPAILNPVSDVHVLHMDESEIVKFAHQPILTSDERLRIRDVKSDKRRKSFEAGRTVVRLLIAEQFGVTPSTVQVGVRDDGSIELVGRPGYISLSHSGTSAAAVFSTGPVGIDIEEIKTRRQDLYTYILHPDEYHLLNTIGLEHNEATILFWTLKEAVLKARCSGLRQSPKEVRLNLEFDDGIGVATIGDHESWHLLFEKRGNLYQTVAFGVTNAI